MKKLMIASMVMFLALAGVAQAYNALQLDIAGGTYDLTTETIVSSGSSFNLYAYLMAGDKDNFLSDTYYLSAAIVPKTGPAGSALGSFSVNGISYNVTSDLIYGTPPLEAALATTDPNDLASHGIYETYFKEIAFSFTSGNQISPYNTQDRALNGSAIPTSGSGMYYAMFSIDTSNMLSGYDVHFDLYNTTAVDGSTTDLSIRGRRFAPFSHDAQSNGHQVPEPGTLALLGMGLVGLGLFGRKK